MDDPEGKSIFWLVGGAGTGKSTISRTIAKSLQAKGQLGASFFFKKGEADRSNSALLFTTIANQLAIRFRSIGSSIKKAVQADPDIPRKALAEQFDKLILQPLSEIKPSSYRARLVLLVDALDECDEKEDIKPIIYLLSRLKNVKTTDVRVFLTSRPDLPIRPTFKKLPEGTYKDVVLHEIPKIEHDISLFLRHEFSEIRKEHSLPGEWPSNQNVERLVKIVIPLFIYVVTLCRFIGDGNWDPNEQIKIVLDYQTN